MTPNATLSNVQEFYKDKSIFITGASGFVGEVLLEKLLRTCSSLNRVYILLRPKKKYTLEQRFQRLLQNPIFEQLYETNPDFHLKITPISGDLLLPGLGISQQDRLTLQENVQIVIHAAASVKLNEPLPVSMEINFHGAGKIVDLCQEILDLDALIYVSTAFTNAERSDIKEIVYPFMNTSKIKIILKDVKDMSVLDKESLDKIQPVILGKKRNTYLYAKAMVENYLEQFQATLPIAIVRPSIVTATAAEPVAGFVDNLSSVSGFIVAVGKGHVRAINVTKDTRADTIPVDYVANLIILAAWKTTLQRKQQTQISLVDYDVRRYANPVLRVYNGCCHNPIGFLEFQKCTLSALSDHPFNNVVSQPKLISIGSTWLFRTHDFIFHWLRAYCIDFIYRPKKSSQSMMAMYNYARSQETVLNFFIRRSWTFEQNNVHKLHAECSLKDQTLFPLFVKDMNWPVYYKNYIAGLKKYTLKEGSAEILPYSGESNKQNFHGITGPG